MTSLLMSNQNCARCNGRMFLDTWFESCKRCRETGASTCLNCWVHYEWTCISCGNVDYLPRVRRRDMQKVIAGKN